MQIIEFAGLSNRPNPGSKLALYLDTVTGVLYRWTGAAYAALALPPATEASGNVTRLLGSNNESFTIHTAAYDDAVTRLRQADFGTLVTSVSNSSNIAIVANGTPASGSAGIVTTDLPPVRGPYAVRLIGDAATRASATIQFTASQTTGAEFRGVAFWAKVKGRTAGPMMAQVYVGNGADPYTLKSIACTVGIPADSKWHLIFIPRVIFAAQNGFVYGTDTITSIGIRDRNDSANLGYPGMLTNAEELQIGVPVYINPFSRPKFLIRFDDSLDDCIVPSATFTADGVNKSWSCYTLLDQFGFGDKGSCFHLTRRLNTSNSLQTFLTDSQLATLASYGWSHCTQSHQDPVDLANNGLRLMGATGYASKAILSVDTVTNTLVTSAAHNITNTYSGYPIIFSGTDLPAPLVTNTVYWARQVTNTTTMTLHPTENDSVANTNVIDLTTTGTAANFTYRYGYSANDGTLQQADLENCIAALTALGYGDTATIYAPNQGALSKTIFAAAEAAGVEMILGITDSGSGYLYPRTRHLHMETTGEVWGKEMFSTSYTVPSAIQTDGVPTAADVRTYIDAVIANGGIGQNYHHALSAANGPVLAAYLEHLRLRSSEGACDVVTAKELRDYLIAAKSLTPGVVY